MNSYRMNHQYYELTTEGILKKYLYNGSETN